MLQNLQHFDSANMLIKNHLTTIHSIDEDNPSHIISSILNESACPCDDNLKFVAPLKDVLLSLTDNSTALLYTKEFKKWFFEQLSPRLAKSICNLYQSIFNEIKNELGDFTLAHETIIQITDAITDVKANSNSHYEKFNNFFNLASYLVETLEGFDEYINKIEMPDPEEEEPSEIFIEFIDEIQNTLSTLLHYSNIDVETQIGLFDSFIYDHADPLQNLFYDNGLDQPSENISTAFVNALIECDFLQFIDANLVVHPSLYLEDESEPDFFVRGVVVPNFELGYTPINLRKIIDQSYLTQDQVGEIIGRSRFSIMRYLADCDDPKHSTMPLKEWNSLLEHLKIHHAL